MDGHQAGGDSVNGASRRIAVAAIGAMMVSCAHAPELKPNDPLAFRGFGPVDPGKARVLFLRPNWLLGGAVGLLIHANDCRFQLGVNQYAVCEIDSKDLTVSGGTALEPYTVELGRWNCLRFVTQRPGLRIVECASIENEIAGASQAWSTHSDPANRGIPKKKPPMPTRRK